MDRDKNDWDKLIKRMGNRPLKEELYDDLLFEFCGDINGLKLLDYGSGTGDIALRAKKKGAEVKAYDPAQLMVKSTAEKIGKENVYGSRTKIPSSKFDIAFCNLVFCIVQEREVKEALKILHKSLLKGGIAFVGFCNPLSSNIKETPIQTKIFSKFKYSEKRSFEKISKEGNFKMTDQHRPLSFYENLFTACHFDMEDLRITQQGSDFIIYKLRKI